MNISLISVTRNGIEISLKIAENLNSNHVCTHYTFEKYPDEKCVSFSSLSGLMGEIFHKTDAIIFICACGTAMRMIAPHIQSKQTDPAVIVVDEQGKFVVSLLSGHIGRGNALARKIAEILDAIPVITTATDIGGKFSPDSFAVANNLHICEIGLSKEIAAAVLNGEKIGLYCDFAVKNAPEIFSKTAEIGITISDSMTIEPFAKTLHLVPKNILIGIGCRKNSDPKKLESFITECLKISNIPLFRIHSVNSIDIKKDEKAIVEFAEKHRIPANFYSAKTLMNVQGNFKRSDFVLKTVGVDNVCERCACVTGGKLLIPKISRDGMTFAAAWQFVDIDFEREML